MQDHKPLVKQENAIGHAVRAGYIYSAMAGMCQVSTIKAFAEGGRTDLIKLDVYELDSIWRK
jgi:hypothetical protein